VEKVLHVDPNPLSWATAKAASEEVKKRRVVERENIASKRKKVLV